jgi:hypothetical protein
MLSMAHSLEIECIWQSVQVLAFRKLPTGAGFQGIFLGSQRGEIIALHANHLPENHSGIFIFLPVDRAAQAMQAEALQRGGPW